VPPDSAEVDSRALRSYTVRVDAPDGRILGTGFFVTPDLVLTCAHVVGDRPEVRIHTDDGAQGTGSVVAVSQIPTGNRGIWPYPDLALIQVPDALRRPPVLLDDRDPRGGEECHAWGLSRRVEKHPERIKQTRDPQGRTTLTILPPWHHTNHGNHGKTSHRTRHETTEDDQGPGDP
jgi:Trypsin-like peptidase domain